MYTGGPKCVSLLKIKERRDVYDNNLFKHDSLNTNTNTNTHTETHTQVRSESHLSNKASEGPTAISRSMNKGER